MAKKLLCVLLSVLMVVSLLPTGLFADEDVDYSLWYWKDGETMVNKYYGDATDITLPTYKSDGTTLSVGIYNTIWGGSSITDSAGDSTIEIIRFPDTYTTIPTSSFRSNASLREVYLPSGLKIGNSNVFYNDPELEYVLFPEGMTCSILDMFKGCTNPDLIIDIQSTTLTSLGSNAYHNAFQDVCGTIVVYSDDMYAMATAAVSTSTNCTATVVYGPVTEIDVTVDVSEVAEEDVPESDSVSLYDGDEAVMTKSVTSSGNWERTLRLTGTTGSESYSVVAADIDGYTAEVTGDVENGFVVTYTADEEEESTELRGIYGGYGSSYNQETDSYSILCTDDLTSSQRETTVGTTSVVFYFDGNSDYASNLQYQVAYGTVYLWNFLDGLVSTGQYADGNTLAMTGNSVSYPLSITDVDTAYSITAGTGWTYDADNPVWIITKIEFLDSSGNVLLTLTEFSSEDGEDETDYTFPIEGVEFATSGWSTTYDSTTGVATFGSWTGLGWWFGSSSTLELSELTITATSDIDWQVVVVYVDGTTSTTVSASDGTCTVTPEATAISQIYVQSKAAGDIAFTSVTYTLAEEDSGDETSTLIEDVDIATSGWSYTYDATTGTITFSEAWAGCGWWFGSSSELILSEFTVTTGNEMTYQVVVEYVDGTSSTTVVSSSDGTCTVTPEATAISQIYIQGYEAGDLTVTGVTYTIAEEDNGTEYKLAFDVMETTNWGGDWWISGTEVNGYSDGSSSVTVTLTDISGLTGSTYLVENASEILITNSGADLEDVVVVFSGTVNGETVSYTYTVGDVASGENAVVVNPVSSELYTLLTTGTDVTATITFSIATADEPTDDPNSSLVTDSARFIYVNETYHAIVLNGHFITIAHSDSDGDGYCDGCYYYMGTDDEDDDSDLVSEEVTVTEPVEDTDTPDEEEDEEDLDVGDTDSSDEETETNPTTGVALALIPMAIAGFAVVSSKRR